MSTMLLWISGPLVPPNTGRGEVGAHCSCASHASSRSLQRCKNASMCAKMEESSKSQGRGQRALMARAVAWYSSFHLSPEHGVARAVGR